MADISDVANALVNYMAGIIYPNGTNQPSAVTDKSGNAIACKVYYGWPTNALDSDLAAGISNVSVFPLPMERNISTLDHSPYILSQPTPTIAATVSGRTVTIGGTVTPGEAVGISVGGTTYAYLVQSGDTLSTIASALADLIPGGTASGDVVTVSSVGNLVARIGVPAVVATPVKRQSRRIQISVWVSDPIVRDILASFLDQNLGDLYRIAIPDGTVANLKYMDSPYQDKDERENLYYRHLRYEAIFETIRTETLMTVVGTNLSLTLQPAP